MSRLQKQRAILYHYATRSLRPGGGRNRPAPCDGPALARVPFGVLVGDFAETMGKGGEGKVTPVELFTAAVLDLYAETHDLILAACFFAKVDHTISLRNSGAACLTRPAHGVSGAPRVPQHALAEIRDRWRARND